jgi:GNAT superfamily N-acetyltransferase
VSGLVIREAVPGDEALVLELLHELAVYERLTDKFHLTAEVIARDFLGPGRACECALAFEGREPVGVMNWYRVYLSFAAQRGIFLEDIYVRERCRGKGYGKAFFAHLARRAAAEKATFIEWLVLDWNTPSIAFYESLGAVRPAVKSEWLRYSLGGAALARVAAP